VKIRSQSRMPAALVAGLVFLAVHTSGARGSIVVLTGSAMTPLAAIAAATVRWLPDFQANALNLSSLVADSEFAERFPTTESGEWIESSREPAVLNSHLESVALLRAGTATYHDYRTPTTIHAGYGCLFAEEPWRLYQASRQALEEPPHFYLKMTFRF